MELRSLVYQSAIAAGAQLHSLGGTTFSETELEVFTQIIIREVVRQVVKLEGANLDD